MSSPIPKNRAAGRGICGFSRAPFLLPTFLSGGERKVGYKQYFFSDIAGLNLLLILLIL
jgi:hypothetical protein